MLEFLIGTVFGIFIGQTYKAFPNIQTYILHIIKELDKYKKPPEEKEEEPPLKEIKNPFKWW